jgi:ComEC/Rec2-related protein
MFTKSRSISFSFFWAALGTIIGSAYFVLGDFRVLTSALVALIASSLVFTTLKHLKKQIISFSFAFLIVFFNYNLRSERTEYPNLEKIQKQYQTSFWKIISEPKDKFFTSEYFIELVISEDSSLQDRVYNFLFPLRLIAQSESKKGLEKNDILILQEPIFFDKLKTRKIKFTKKDKIFFELQNSKNLVFHHHQTNFIDEIRLGISRYYQNTLSHDNAPIITSILLGSRSSDLPVDFINAVRKLGLGHFLAASGFNLMILTLLLTWIFKYIGIKTKTSSLLSMIAITLYMGLAGFSPSVVRAGIFALVYLGLKFFNRKTLSTKLLIYMAGLILFLDPYAMFDIGFQLSYLATMAIIMWTPAINEKLKNFKIPNIFKEAIVVTLAVQFFVYPLSVFYFSNLQIWSFLANILISPFLSFLTILGFLGLSPIIEPYSSTIRFIIEKSQYLPGINSQGDLSLNGLFILTIFINIIGLMIFSTKNTQDIDNLKNIKDKSFDEIIKNYFSRAIFNKSVQMSILISCVLMFLAIEIDPINVKKYQIQNGLIKNNKSLVEILNNKKINHKYFKIGNLEALLIKDRSSLKKLGELTENLREVNILFLPNLSEKDMYLKTLIEITKPQFIICSIKNYESNKALKPKTKANLEIITKHSNTILNEATIYIKDDKFWKIKGIE